MRSPKLNHIEMIKTYCRSLTASSSPNCVCSTPTSLSPPASECLRTLLQTHSGSARGKTYVMSETFNIHLINFHWMCLSVCRNVGSHISQVARRCVQRVCLTALIRGITLSPGTHSSLPVRIKSLNINRTIILSFTRTPTHCNKHCASSAQHSAIQFLINARCSKFIQKWIIPTQMAK